MTNHGRNSALLIALVAVFAMALSGSAFAAHDLKIYKVEKQVDLNSDDTGVDLSCATGDIATDGMWRIDHADQDPDELGNVSFLAESVDVTEAYPSSIDTYHFRFLKNAIGRAQAKVFLTCLGKKTYAADGHSHNIQTTPVVTPAWTATGWGGGTVTATSGVPGAGEAAWTTAPVASTTPAKYAATLCPSNSFVAQPGFKVIPSAGPASDPIQYTGRLNESDPNPAMNGWTWQVDLSPDTSAKVAFYGLCIKRKVQTAAGENHKLVYRYDTATDSIASHAKKTSRISCKDSYKAMVAGFRFTFGSLYYLGMDPQPKSRDFRFLNPTGSSSTANLAAICLNYRTT
jgi:hypothetical protein